MRVLVVDDDHRVLRFITISLRGAGYDVLTATTGEEALTLAGSQHPDAIVLDVLMPRMDGFEIMRRLRAFTHVPVLAFSIDDSARLEMLKLGATDFLAKPFDPDELVRRIAEIMPGRP